MAISLCSALALGALLQTAAPREASESLAALRAQVARDSADGPAWLLLGQTYLRVAEALGPAPGPRQDSAVTRAALDTADAALTRAAVLLGPPGSSAAGDSARVLRVGAWSARSRLTWEGMGIGAGPEVWGPLPADLRVPPVLEELGENLLRACPQHGVLLTASDADSYAAWYMRFARGLRPDVLVVPLAAWRSDRALGARLARDLKLAAPPGPPGRPGEDRWLAALAKRRPVCVSMAFERPPSPRPRLKWETRPLVWVAGPVAKSDRVPPHDFVFAALGAALAEGDPWAQPALAVYARAARTTRALCEPLSTFKAAGGISACRR